MISFTLCLFYQNRKKERKKEVQGEPTVVSRYKNITVNFRFQIPRQNLCQDTWAY